MQLKPLTRGITGIIPGGISVLDFAIVAQTDQISAKEILNILVANKIGSFEGEIVNFNQEDKLKAALFAIRQGAPIDDVSIYLNWKDFEGLVAEILESKNFEIKKNLVLTNPRMEIDVVGINHGIAVLIDCKHWKKMSVSSLGVIVKKQVKRVKHFVAKTQEAMAVPVIVTLYQEEISFIDNVPIVPILQLSSFLDEFYGNLDDLKTIET
ncbi:MAG TPA: restriction endonuclease, partial [Nitrosopumilaceae archaeon]|nr:restriction endonuclease [Nitrosopumilaceae archaeon]